MSEGPELAVDLVHGGGPERAGVEVARVVDQGVDAAELGLGECAPGCPGATHKQQRADDLLAAARRLATAEGVHAVPLTQIAAQAGVHLSGVRRSFASREEIHLRLAAEGWPDWAEALTAALADLRGTATATPETVADAFARTLAERPLFCDLLGHVPVSLERGAAPETLREFKLSALDPVDAATAHPGPGLESLYAEDPRPAHSVTDFKPRLTHLLRATARGLTGR
ncbi:TetR family transcriptional regulator [Streptomyces sp. 3211.6]|uniref:TetR family transcriptional regulator n=1 Tax=Streptomyces sp. 3211.6 TaxID=1938845 RepID=UPI000EB0CB1F|nr:TetR family transcriptional regulator [Streptomyces sp. 3211.6]RKT02869.1 TetR family transcriptional regulator [Streptomyces sp. 3211.6]